MANLGDISKINLPNGNVVSIKDATARAQANWNTNNGVKNLLDVTYDTYTNNECSYAKNADGSITLTISSTVAAQRQLNLTDKIDNIYDGMIINGSPTGYSTGTIEYLITGLKADGTYQNEQFSYNGAESTINRGTPKIQFSILVKSGVTARTVTFYPMVREVGDSTYKPYALPNSTLTQGVIWNTNNGVKNLLINNAVTTTTSYGITYTVNSDKSIKVTGTSNAYYAYNVAGSRTYANALPIPKGTYIVKGGVTYTNTTPIYIQFGIMTSISAAISWHNIGAEDYEFTVTNDTTRIVYELYIPDGVYSTQYNYTFYPMICTKAQWDISHEYQPYALPNTKITPELIELVDSGAKNLYNPSNTSTSASGLTGTITRNSDGSYTISGTTSGTVYYNMGSWIAPEDGYYILSGGSAAESASQLIYDDHDWQTYESGNKKKLAYWTKGSTHNLYIRLSAGMTISNVTFKPMICTKAAWDVSQKYVPYGMSNAELTPTVKDSGNAFTTGSDYTLCDACTLTVPIPTSGVKAAHILAGLAFNSTAPRGIIISLSNNSADFNTSSKMLAKVESSDYIRLTAECFYYNYGGSNVNIYVWVKSSSSGNNRVASSMQLLN